MSSSKIIYTIGHSTRTLDEFMALLYGFHIELLVDVRHFPGSRKFPHFNKPELSNALAQVDIGYIHIESLGGRRKADPDSKNSAWRHPAFRGYADYMETETFLLGMTQLIKLANIRRTVFMCSEAVWWRCHRSMISDMLKADAWQVLHIMSAGKATEHPFTAPAKVINGELTYRV